MILIRSLMLGWAALALSVSIAKADLVTFEDRSGPPLFGNPKQTLVYNFPDVTATFNGGTVLCNATGAPADETCIYATAPFGGLYTNPLTITFSTPVNNFFLELLNGNVSTENYTIADNAGHSQTFSIPPNLNSGLIFYSIPASGSVVTITSAASGGFWDFAIDNVGFNQATPGSVPEPAAIILLAGGLALVLVCRQH